MPKFLLKMLQPLAAEDGKAQLQNGVQFLLKMLQNQ